MLLAVSGGCRPAHLPPAEEQQRVREQTAGSWLPCSTQFNVPRLGAQQWVLQRQRECTGKHAEACRDLAVVERHGCLESANLTKAAALADSACGLGDVDGCVLRVEICDQDRAACDQHAAREAASRAVAFVTERCARGGDDDCNLLDQWHRQGGLGLPRKEGVADRLLNTRCDADETPACLALGRRRLHAGAGSAAEQVFRRHCRPGDRADWACSALLDMARQYEAGNTVPRNMREACRIFQSLCLLGDTRGCKERSRLEDSC
jgi:TPR repeat protein